MNKILSASSLVSLKSFIAGLIAGRYFWQTASLLVPCLLIGQVFLFEKYTDLNALGIGCLVVGEFIFWGFSRTLLMRTVGCGFYGDEEAFLSLVTLVAFGVCSILLLGPHVDGNPFGDLGQWITIGVTLVVGLMFFLEEIPIHSDFLYDSLKLILAPMSLVVAAAQIYFLWATLWVWIPIILVALGGAMLFEPKLDNYSSSVPAFWVTTLAIGVVSSFCQLYF